MLYLDLDGVLADFDTWRQDNFQNPDCSETEFYLECFRLYDRIFLESKFIEPTEELLEVIGYFKSFRILSTSPRLDKFVQANLENGEDIKEILRRYNFFRKNKLEWVYNNNLGLSSTIIVNNSREKSLYCKGRADTLVDDFPSTLNPWVKKGGEAYWYRRVGDKWEIEKYLRNLS